MHSYMFKSLHLEKVNQWKEAKKNSRRAQTMDSSSPSPNRRAKSHKACVVDSTLIGSL